MNDRIRALIRKEWVDVSRNRTVVSTLIVLPALLTLIPIGTMIAGTRAMAASGAKTPSLKDVPDHILALTSDPRVATLMMLTMSALMFLSIVPAVVPSIMAAHSIVGERQARSLEPLLATPLRTWELLAAKLVAMILPPLVPTLLGYGVYVGVVFVVAPDPVFALVSSPPFLLTVGLLGPLLAILSVTFGIMISSRADDLQSAQALSGLIALPVLGIGMAQLFGAVSVSLTAVLARALAVAVLDAGAVLLCVSIFERETILSRWK